MVIDTLFGTQIDDLVYRPNLSPTKPINLSRNLIEDLQREYTFNIDLGQYNDGSPVDTKAIFIKGDKNTSILKAYITQNGLIVNLTGFTITANIKEGSNDVVTVPCNITDVTAGLIEINLAETYVDEYGENIFEISLQKGDKVVLSQQYKYTVFDSLGEGNIGTEIQMTTLQSLIQQVQESKVMVDNIVAELEITQTDIDDILEMVGGL